SAAEVLTKPPNEIIGERLDFRRFIRTRWRCSELGRLAIRHGIEKTDGEPGFCAACDLAGAKYRRCVRSIHERRASADETGELRRASDAPGVDEFQARYVVAEVAAEPTEREV